MLGKFLAEKVQKEMHMPMYQSGHINGRKEAYFELLHWGSLLILHNIDMMHVEKNVYEKMISMLLGIGEKTKDNVKTRLDMKALGIRPSLQQNIDEHDNRVPLACFTLNK